MSITYQTSPALTNDALNALFLSAWNDHQPRDFQPVLERSIAYVCAFDGPEPVGFVNLAWDGGAHAFVLDTTVHGSYQRRGIGGELLRRAADVARERGVTWLHVDFEPHLELFYRAAGFLPTSAGVLRL